MKPAPGTYLYLEAKFFLGFPGFGFRAFGGPVSGPFSQDLVFRRAALAQRGDGIPDLSQHVFLAGVAARKRGRKHKQRENHKQPVFLHTLSLGLFLLFPLVGGVTAVYKNAWEIMLQSCTPYKEKLGLKNIYLIRIGN